MPRTLTDDEYNFLQGRRQIADFVESIYNDPTLAKEAKALIKKKYPNIQIPDYDIEQRIEERIEASEKKRQDDEDAKRRSEEDERFSQLRAKTQKDYGFTDEAMNRLEQMMIERNIGDYEAAAMLMATKEPRASEPTFESNRWNHEKQDSFKEVSSDPEGYAQREIMKALHADRVAQRGR